MGLFQKLIYGVDLDAEQARSNKLDEQLREQNRQALARGSMSQATFDTSNAQIAAGELNVEKEVDTAFNEGLNEGIDNIRNGVGDAVTMPLRLISWKLWVIGAIALFLYMGGAFRLKGVLAK